MTTTVGDNKQQEHATDDEGSNKWARVVRGMVTTMRVACDKEGDGNGSKSNGDEGAMQQRGWWQWQQE
jgi:hypothetical protein